jgi:transcriptional regulator with XRE-family HTH domain
MSTTDSRVMLHFLRAWRAYLVLSIGELSDASGVSKDTIVQLEHERTRANPATVGKLAKALDITRRQLVYEQPPEQTMS